MLTPHELHQQLPLSAKAARTVASTRQAIRAILDGTDRRLLAIVGPCSIHDPHAALDYATRLQRLAGQVAGQLLLVMRTYLEKPRTTLGWRGLLSDPHLDGSCDTPAGLHAARQLLLTLNARGVACATETLDPMLVDYTADLVSWTAIGARTAQSQVHRAMASGLPMPVGCKNGTDGDPQVAVDAVEAARADQCYPALDEAGRISLRRSAGNRHGHVVLRGGRAGPNCDAAGVAHCTQLLQGRGLPATVVVDCSHANSGKVAARQAQVLDMVAAQIEAGDDAIVGVMLESHLSGGAQSLSGQGLAGLEYGVSVTDACLDWDSTSRSLLHLAERLAPVLPRRTGGQHDRGSMAAPTCTTS